MRVLACACVVFACACGSSPGKGPDGGPPPGKEGTLSFGPQTPTGLPGDVAALGDFDGDGKLDVALASDGAATGGVGLGNGDGTFRAGASFSTGNSVQDSVAADNDGDGKLDLSFVLSTAVNGSNMSAIRGKGDGTFSMPSGFAAEMEPVAVIAADFDGDGKTDLAVANEGSGNASVFIVGQSTHANYQVGPTPDALASADFDGDGHPDLVVGGGNPSQGGFVAVLRGGPGGQLTPLQTYTTFQREITAFGIGDLDGDGKLDVVAGDGGGKVTLGIGGGDGSFTFGTPVPTLNDFGAVVALAVTDYNGGGRPDVLALDIPGAGTAFLSVLVNLGHGALAAPIQLGQFDTIGVLPASLAVGDLDGDGRPDVLVAHAEAVDVFLNTSH